MLGTSVKEKTSFFLFEIVISGSKRLCFSASLDLACEVPNFKKIGTSNTLVDACCLAFHIFVLLMLVDATFMSLFDLFQSLPLLNHENLGRNLQTLFLSRNALMEQLQVAKRKLQGLMLRKVLEKIGIHHNPSSFDRPEHHP